MYSKKQNFVRSWKISGRNCKTGFHIFIAETLLGVVALVTELRTYVSDVINSIYTGVSDSELWYFRRFDGPMRVYWLIDFLRRPFFCGDPLGMKYSIYQSIVWRSIPFVIFEYHLYWLDNNNNGLLILFCHPDIARWRAECWFHLIGFLVTSIYSVFHLHCHNNNLLKKLFI